MIFFLAVKIVKRGKGERRRIGGGEQDKRRQGRRTKRCAVATGKVAGDGRPRCRVLVTLVCRKAGIRAGAAAAAAAATAYLHL